ncbi:hypothetical protein scyTo_0004118 [Scyliorhinus torazame]|uniref:Uncharacterized protein n=1 Tax=Scyliorhinus torazame TaxID=75743 RepID=A0A401NL10_SCYTO|nr:hypothetical protein [Scyliorhinus torazame]
MWRHESTADGQAAEPIGRQSDRGDQRQVRLLEKRARREVGNSLPVDEMWAVFGGAQTWAAQTMSPLQRLPALSAHGNIIWSLGSV